MVVRICGHELCDIFNTKGTIIIEYLKIRSRGWSILENVTILLKFYNICKFKIFLISKFYVYLENIFLLISFLQPIQKVGKDSILITNENCHNLESTWIWWMGGVIYMVISMLKRDITLDLWWIPILCRSECKSM